MDDEAPKRSWVPWVLLVIVLVYYSNKVDTLKKELWACEDESDSLETMLYDANYQIEDAQSAAWSSYENMGYTLENLYINY
jgi:hypothetical protein